MQHPPVSDEEFARWTLGEAPQLQVLRHEVQQAVLDGVVPAADPADLAERLVIVVTELAGNALVHGRAPVLVMLHRSNGDVVVDVVDGDRESVPVVDDRRASGEGGLGLVLTQRLAGRVGWYPTVAGKGVWASFSLRAL
ncbi:ATP-binding protein [Actinoplanes sichuanensis]|uniref:ATP-binding protein n=1 Tax=Actinoplanes sichuanensis TaxID=512349 RepID=A0ABW4A2S1_9ACTN